MPQQSFPISIHGHGIFTYIWLILMVNVGNIYQSHGCYMVHRLPLYAPHLQPEWVVGEQVNICCQNSCGNRKQLWIYHISGQISIIPKPELRGFWRDSLTKPLFKVTSAEVVINCPEYMLHDAWNV